MPGCAERPSPEGLLWVVLKLIQWSLTPELRGAGHRQDAEGGAVGHSGARRLCSEALLAHMHCVGCS